MLYVPTLYVPYLRFVSQTVYAMDKIEDHFHIYVHVHYKRYLDGTEVDKLLVYVNVNILLSTLHYFWYPQSYKKTQIYLPRKEEKVTNDKYVAYASILAI